MTGKGDPPRRDDPPLELELADVPRRLPRGNSRDSGPAPSGSLGPADARGAPRPPTGSTTAPLPPATGSTTAARPPATGYTTYDLPSPWPRRILLLVLAAALVYGGYGGYRRLTRPDVFSLSSPYRTHTGIKIDLPGGSRGWKADRRQRMKKEMGTAWVRADAIFHGENLLAADQIIFTVRAHSRGGFGAATEPELMRRQLETQLRQGVSQTGATVSNLSCVVDQAVRPETTVACFGRIGYLERDLPAGLFIWQAGTDDLLGIGYATSGDSLDPLLELARTAR